MKIALCFAGQPRFIDRMNFDNLTKDHEVVTYAHFWWDETYRGDFFAWNSNLKYPDDYDPIADFEEKMKPKRVMKVRLDRGATRMFNRPCVYGQVV